MSEQDHQKSKGDLIAELDELRAQLSRATRKQQETEGLLSGARAILVGETFVETAQAIFDVCKEIIQAQSGYVALRSTSGDENEVVFLESGGLPCTVDPDLPMPVRGLRGVAYELGRPVFENDFAGGKWAELLPDGHVSLRNVLFAPLNLQGETVGVMGLANKESDFTAEDAKMAAAFGELAVMALDKSRREDERLRLFEQTQQAQKLESLGVLAGGIAHDFNNLLVGILGNADLVRRDLPLVSPTREILDDITTSAQKAAELCRQMLAYAGKGQFITGPVDLSELVRGMTGRLEVFVSKTSSLEFDLASGLPTFQGDSTQIRQLVTNLTTNASEALGDVSGRILLHTGVVQCDATYLKELFSAVELHAGDYVFLEMSDTGCGMEPTTVEKIFDPFFTTKFIGRGLGLAAVQGIVRSHRGAIEVRSEVGTGTTIRVLFPLVDQLLELEDSDQEELPQFTGRTVLLADDDPMVLVVARRMLELLGLNVISARDGREATRIFRGRAKEIDFVLLDLSMPHLSGVEALAAMQRIRSDIKVILTSGYNEREATERFAGKGLAGFIQKPYLLTTMQDEITRVLG